MLEKIDAMNEYFDLEIVACNARRDALLADSRADEADFEKIRANVFDIFKTILKVAEKTPDVRAFFETKAEEIPTNWQESYDKAKMHGDELKMHNECIKIDAITEIRAEFLRVWEGRA